MAFKFHAACAKNIISAIAAIQLNVIIDSYKIRNREKTRSFNCRSHVHLNK